MAAKLKYDAFVSYNTQDADAALNLVQQLRQRDVRVFIDRDLAPSTLWQKALPEALQMSRTVVVLFGATGLGPAQSDEVLSLVAAGSIPIIPVLLPGADPRRLPPSLSRFIWVDFRSGLDDEKAMQELLRGVQGSTSPASPIPSAPLPLFDRLSPRARNAVLRADAFRSSRGAGRIHMEHLLTGLFDEGDEPGRQAFARAGLDRQGLVKLLREASFASPGRRIFPPSSTDSLPPLSAHSEQALRAAQGFADAERSVVIQTLHLLRGFLSVVECEVVGVVWKAGLRAEAGPLLAELSIRPASTGDQPVDQDTLGFKPYVEALAEFLVNEDTHPPLTLSIEGEWGSGKSSFMLQLEKALRQRYPRLGRWLGSLPNRLRTAWISDPEGRGARLRRELQPPCCLTVRFNAWRHDKEDALWAAFASEFLRRIARQRVRPRRWYGHLKLFVARYRWRNGGLEMLRAAAVWSLLIALGIAIPVAVYSAGWTFGISGWIEKLGKAEDLVKGLAALGGAGAYVAGFISLFLKAKEVVGNPLEVNLRKYLQSPDYDGHVTFVESFHEDFRRIVDAYAGKRKVYVFIDDLDRCEVPKAADLMQALNLLITDDPRLIFIIGMDREKVAAGLAVKYETLLPYLMPDGRNEKGEVDPRLGLDYGFTFIEKFVQLPFRVPTPKPVNLRWFLGSLSGRPLGAPPLDSLPDSPAPEAHADAGAGGTQLLQDQAPGNKGDAATLPSEASARSAVVGRRAERRERLKLVLRVDSDAIAEAALMAAPALDNNPRRLKQFVNLFRLRAYIAGEIGAFDEVEGKTLTLPQLGKFVAICLAWPGLLTDLAEKQDLLPALHRAALGDGHDDLWEERPEVRWFRQPALLSLLKYGCVEGTDFEGTPDPKAYSLAEADLDRLLRVSPKVVRTPSPPPPPPTSPEPQAREEEAGEEEAGTAAAAAAEALPARRPSRKAARKKVAAQSAASRASSTKRTVTSKNGPAAKSAAPRQKAASPKAPRPAPKRIDHEGEPPRSEFEQHVETPSESFETAS